MTIFTAYFWPNICPSDEIKKHEICGVYGTRKRDGKHIQIVSRKVWRKQTHLGDTREMVL
jgi:hypothetical protein